MAYPQSVTAAVHRCNHTSLILREAGGEPFKFRCGVEDAVRVVPGQMVSVEVWSRWDSPTGRCAMGRVSKVWTEVAALGLTPLGLRNHGPFPLRAFDVGEEEPGWAAHRALNMEKTRKAVEFDAIAWGVGVGVDPKASDACLVADAAELRGHPEATRELLMEVLEAELRCIDAHAHLGNMVFEKRPERARLHYEVAVGIAELSLAHFDELLLWGMIGNRPYLRALRGLGLCQWRAGAWAEAESTFAGIMRLSPPDEQGIRFCLADVKARRAWAS